MTTNPDHTTRPIPLAVLHRLKKLLSSLEEVTDPQVRREVVDLRKLVRGALGESTGASRLALMSLPEAVGHAKLMAENVAQRVPPKRSSSAKSERLDIPAGTQDGPGDLGKRILFALDGTLDRKALAAALYLFEAEPGCTEFPRSWKGARKLLDVSSLGWPAAVRCDFVKASGDGYELLQLGQAACVLLQAAGPRLDTVLGLTWANLIELAVKERT